jgi:hypothetical protein
MRRLAATVIAISGVTACAAAETAAPDASRADARQGPDADDDVDAPPGTPDAMVDAAVPLPDAMPAGGHLLLSEVVLTPNAGEMIEVVNPTGSAIDLTNYYLTDVPSYFRLPAGTQTIDGSDFIARFPSGASIAAGAVITIAIDTAANFQTNYATPPTYSLNAGTMIVSAGPGALNLTNSGEPIVLFYWDGATDLVYDCDIVIAGVPTATNALIVKSALAVDGPDPGTTPSAYAADAMTIPTTQAPGGGQSLKRILLETGHELQTGTGNGLDGEDETSESITTTWSPTPYTLPTPGADALP